MRFATGVRMGGRSLALSDGGAGGYSYTRHFGLRRGGWVFANAARGNSLRSAWWSDEGTFDGHTIRMEGMLRFVFRLAGMLAQGA